MKDILAILNLPDTAGPVLRAADLLGARLGVAVRVLHVLPPDAHLPGEELVPEALKRRHEMEHIRRSAALRAMAADEGDWREVAGPTGTVVAEAAAEAGLVVMGRAPDLFFEDARQALDAALLDARAPVLLPADAEAERLGLHVALAWKPGEPAERALAAARELLLRAEHVSVLIATGDDTEQGEPPAGLLEELAKAGVRAGVHQFVAGEATGAVLCAEAMGLGADMLVMGAYSHSRLVERFFGGATADVIAGAPLPVLLRH